MPAQTTTTRQADTKQKKKKEMGKGKRKGIYLSSLAIFACYLLQLHVVKRGCAPMANHATLCPAAQSKHTFFCQHLHRNELQSEWRAHRLAKAKTQLF